MEYVNRVLLEVNGQEITDFDSFTEGERDLAGQVKLMNKTGTVQLLERPSCSLEYVIPKDAPEFDFTAVVDGTITVDYQNGTRKTYTGVRTAKIGATKFGDDKAASRTIDFFAAKLVTN